MCLLGNKYSKCARITLKLINLFYFDFLIHLSLSPLSTIQEIKFQLQISCSIWDKQISWFRSRLVVGCIKFIIPTYFANLFLCVYFMSNRIHVTYSPNEFGLHLSVFSFPFCVCVYGLVGVCVCGCVCFFPLSWAWIISPGYRLLLCGREKVQLGYMICSIRRTWTIT